MWRGRVHGLWFVAAVMIAVIGVVALGSGSGGAGSWVIAIATFAGVAYCLFRASRRNPGPSSER